MVADYEFDIGFSELKMADPIWWHEILETLRYVEPSENKFDEKVIARNLKDSDSGNSGSDAGREKEVMRELWMLSKIAFTG